MQPKRFWGIVLSTVLATVAVIFLTLFLRTQPVLTQGPVESPGWPLVVAPDPPFAHEPADVRLFLHNDAAAPIQLYAQFYWSEFGVGMELHPIEGRRSFTIPAQSDGSSWVVWVPPDAQPYCFYADLFDLPDATRPISHFQRNVIVQAFPDPTQPFSEVLPFPLRNPLAIPANVTMTVEIPPDAAGWQAVVIPPAIPMMAAGAKITAHVVFTYTGGQPVPDDGDVIFGVRAFANGEPIGGFDKVFGPPLRLHVRPEPIYAESEISVEPYPVPPGEPAEVCAEVRNIAPEPRQAIVRFKVAPLGMGLLYEPMAPPIYVDIPAHGIRRPCVHWVSPHIGPFEGGQFGIEVEVQTPKYPHPLRSWRVLDVRERLVRDSISRIVLPVRNSTSQPATITMKLIQHIPEWDIALVPLTLTNVPAGDERWVTLTVQIGPNGPLPLDRAPVADVEARIGEELIGGFRKVYRPPVPIHRPGDPVYAESEIKVSPYPPHEREPTEICVELRNPTDEDQVMEMDLRWAEFGIGLPFHLIRTTRPFTVPAHGLAVPCTMWVPPHGGRFGFEVEVRLPEHERHFISQRVIDVGEILLPNQPTVFEFPVGNPFQYPISVTLGMIRHLPQWEVWFEPKVFHLGVGQTQHVVMHVVPVQRPGDPEPREGEPVIDVEAYWDNGQEHGLLGGFRKLFFPPIPIHRPEDPPYAEREIGVFPYPPQAGEPTRIQFEARNPTTATQQMTVTFQVGTFGIGLPFYPITSKSYTVPPERSFLAEVVWVPPFAGKFCVQVKVEAPFFEEPFVSARNIDVVRLPRPYGTPEVFPIVVGDGGILTRPLTITLGLREYLHDWQVELEPREIVLGSSGNVTATTMLTLTPPADPRDLPKDGGPVADVAGFVNGELIGGIRKVWRPPVPLGHLGEPGYAESEIHFTPDPPVAHEPVTFTSEVRNNTAHPYTITVEFGWADFGVGIPFSNTNMVPTMTQVFLSPYMTQTVMSVWEPQKSGHYCLQIILTDAETGQRQHSQRNVDVDREPYKPCQPFTKEFWLQNSTALPVTVTIGVGAINLPAGWSYSTNITETVLQPYQGITVTLTITPPCGTGAQGTSAMLFSQDDGTTVPATINVEGYIDGELAGGIQVQLQGTLQEMIYLPIVLRGYRP